jgi:flagellar biosynthesis protein FliP
MKTQNGDHDAYKCSLFLAFGILYTTHWYAANVYNIHVKGRMQPNSRMRIAFTNLKKTVKNYVVNQVLENKMASFMAMVKF